MRGEEVTYSEFLFGYTNIYGKQDGVFWRIYYLLYGGSPNEPYPHLRTVDMDNGKYCYALLMERFYCPGKDFFLGGTRSVDEC